MLSLGVGQDSTTDNHISSNTFEEQPQQFTSSRGGRTIVEKKLALRFKPIQQTNSTPMAQQQPYNQEERQQTSVEKLPCSASDFDTHIFNLRKELKTQRCASWASHKMDRDRRVRCRGKALSVPGRTTFRTGASRLSRLPLASCAAFVEEPTLGAVHARALPESTVAALAEGHDQAKQTKPPDSSDKQKPALLSKDGCMQCSKNDSPTSPVRRQSCPTLSPIASSLPELVDLKSRGSVSDNSSPIIHQQSAQDTMDDQWELQFQSPKKQIVTNWHRLEAKMEKEAERKHAAQEQCWNAHDEAEIRHAAQKRCSNAYHREQIRVSLLKKAGSSLKAFRTLDQNGSGAISLSEFESGIRALDVKWEDITGFETFFELFRLFDQPEFGEGGVVSKGPKGYLTFFDLFPFDGKGDHDPTRMSTPEFWNYWCTCNEDMDPSRVRNALWEASPEQKLRFLNKARVCRRIAEARKNWMRGAIHSLKDKGKTDAQCREMVAQHLPKGSGPKDSVDIHTFSEMDVHACKKAYAKELQKSAKNASEFVSEMQSLRMSLHSAKNQLQQTTTGQVSQRRKTKCSRSSSFAMRQ